MERNIFSRVAGIKPILIGGDDLALPVDNAPATPTQPISTPVGTIAHLMDGAIKPTFEQPLQIPPSPIKVSVGTVAHVINTNAPADVLMGDVKHPIATAPTGGVKLPSSIIRTPTPAPAETTTKAPATTEKETYKKWFVLTVVVLGIIILYRVFK